MLNTNGLARGMYLVTVTLDKSKEVTIRVFAE